jgi:hypothetical protein
MFDYFSKFYNLNCTTLKNLLLNFLPLPPFQHVLWKITHFMPRCSMKWTEILQKKLHFLSSERWVKTRMFTRQEGRKIFLIQMMKKSIAISRRIYTCEVLEKDLYLWRFRRRRKTYRCIFSSSALFAQWIHDNNEQPHGQRIEMLIFLWKFWLQIYRKVKVLIWEKNWANE